MSTPTDRELLEQLQKDIAELKLAQREFLTVEQVSDYTGYSQSTIYKLGDKGAFPRYKPNGKKLYYKKSEIDAWIFSNRSMSTDEIDAEAEKYLAEHDQKAA